MPIEDMLCQPGGQEDNSGDDESGSDAGGAERRKRKSKITSPEEVNYLVHKRKTEHATGGTTSQQHQLVPYNDARKNNASNPPGSSPREPLMFKFHLQNDPEFRWLQGLAEYTPLLEWNPYTYDMGTSAAATAPPLTLQGDAAQKKNKSAPPRESTSLKRRNTDPTLAGMDKQAKQREYEKRKREAALTPNSTLFGDPSYYEELELLLEQQLQAYAEWYAEGLQKVQQIEHERRKWIRAIELAEDYEDEQLAGPEDEEDPYARKDGESSDSGLDNVNFAAEEGGISSIEKAQRENARQMELNRQGLNLGNVAGTRLLASQRIELEQEHERIQAMMAAGTYPGSAGGAGSLGSGGEVAQDDPNKKPDFIGQDPYTKEENLSSTELKSRMKDLFGKNKFEFLQRYLQKNPIRSVVNFGYDQRRFAIPTDWTQPRRVLTRWEDIWGQLKMVKACLGRPPVKPRSLHFCAEVVLLQRQIIKDNLGPLFVEEEIIHSVFNPPRSQSLHVVKMLGQSVFQPSRTAFSKQLVLEHMAAATHSSGRSSSGASNLKLLRAIDGSPASIEHHAPDEECTTVGSPGRGTKSANLPIVPSMGADVLPAAASGSLQLSHLKGVKNWNFVKEEIQPLAPPANFITGMHDYAVWFQQLKVSSWRWFVPPELQELAIQAVYALQDYSLECADKDRNKKEIGERRAAEKAEAKRQLEEKAAEEKRLEERRTKKETLGFMKNPEELPVWLQRKSVADNWTSPIPLMPEYSPNLLLEQDAEEQKKAKKLGDDANPDAYKRQTARQTTVSASSAGGVAAAAVLRRAVRKGVGGLAALTAPTASWKAKEDLEKKDTVDVRRKTTRGEDWKKETKKKVKQQQTMVQQRNEVTTANLAKLEAARAAASDENEEAVQGGPAASSAKTSKKKGKKKKKRNEDFEFQQQREEVRSVLSEESTGSARGTRFHVAEHELPSHIDIKLLRFLPRDYLRGLRITMHGMDILPHFEESFLSQHNPMSPRTCSIEKLGPPFPIFFEKERKDPNRQPFPRGPTFPEFYVNSQDDLKSFGKFPGFDALETKGEKPRLAKLKQAEEDLAYCADSAEQKRLLRYTIKTLTETQDKAFASEKLKEELAEDELQKRQKAGIQHIPHTDPEERGVKQSSNTKNCVVGLAFPDPNPSLLQCTLKTALFDPVKLRTHLWANPRRVKDDWTGMIRFNNLLKEGLIPNVSIDQALALDEATFWEVLAMNTFPLSGTRRRRFDRFCPDRNLIFRDTRPVRVRGEKSAGGVADLERRLWVPVRPGITNGPPSAGGSSAITSGGAAAEAVAVVPGGPGGDQGSLAAPPAVAVAAAAPPVKLPTLGGGGLSTMRALGKFKRMKGKSPGKSVGFAEGAEVTTFATGGSSENHDQSVLPTASTPPPAGKDGPQSTEDSTTLSSSSTTNPFAGAVAAVASKASAFTMMKSMSKLKSALKGGNVQQHVDDEQNMAKFFPPPRRRKVVRDYYLLGGEIYDSSDSDVESDIEQTKMPHPRTGRTFARGVGYYLLNPEQIIRRKSGAIAPVWQSFEGKAEWLGGLQYRLEVVITTLVPAATKIKLLGKFNGKQEEKALRWVRKSGEVKILEDATSEKSKASSAASSSRTGSAASSGAAKEDKDAASTGEKKNGSDDESSSGSGSSSTGDEDGSSSSSAETSSNEKEHQNEEKNPQDGGDEDPDGDAKKKEGQDADSEPKKKKKKKKKKKSKKRDGESTEQGGKAGDSDGESKDDGTTSTATEEQKAQLSDVEGEIKEGDDLAGVPEVQSTTVEVIAKASWKRAKRKLGGVLGAMKRGAGAQDNSGEEGGTAGGNDKKSDDDSATALEKQKKDSAKKKKMMSQTLTTFKSSLPKIVPKVAAPPKPQAHVQWLSKYRFTWDARVSKIRDLQRAIETALCEKLDLEKPNTGLNVQKKFSGAVGKLKNIREQLALGDDGDGKPVGIDAQLEAMTNEAPPGSAEKPKAVAAEMDDNDGADEDGKKSKKKKKVSFGKDGLPREEGGAIPGGQQGDEKDNAKAEGDEQNKSESSTSEGKKGGKKKDTAAGAGTVGAPPEEPVVPAQVAVPPSNWVLRIKNSDHLDWPPPELNEKLNDDTYVFKGRGKTLLHEEDEIEWLDGPIEKEGILDTCWRTKWQSRKFEALRGLAWRKGAFSGCPLPGSALAARAEARASAPGNFLNLSSATSLALAIEAAASQQQKMLADKAAAALVPKKAYAVEKFPRNMITAPNSLRAIHFGFPTSKHRRFFLFASPQPSSSKINYGVAAPAASHPAMPAGTSCSWVTYRLDIEQPRAPRPPAQEDIFPKPLAAAAPTEENLRNYAPPRTEAIGKAAPFLKMKGLAALAAFGGNKRPIRKRERMPRVEVEDLDSPFIPPPPELVSPPPAGAAAGIASVVTADDINSAAPAALPGTTTAATGELIATTINEHGETVPAHVLSVLEEIENEERRKQRDEKYDAGFLPATAEDRSDPNDPASIVQQTFRFEFHHGTTSKRSINNARPPSNSRPAPSALGELGLGAAAFQPALRNFYRGPSYQVLAILLYEKLDHLRRGYLARNEWEPALAEFSAATLHDLEAGAVGQQHSMVEQHPAGLDDELTPDVVIGRANVNNRDDHFRGGRKLTEEVGASTRSLLSELSLKGYATNAKGEMERREFMAFVQALRESWGEKKLFFRLRAMLLRRARDRIRAQLLSIQDAKS